MRLEIAMGSGGRCGGGGGGGGGRVAKWRTERGMGFSGALSLRVRCRFDILPC